MPNKMLIDASHQEETRVVVTRGNRIEEFDFESQDKKQLKGNIYLARVTRVEPSLQAAFVEYGGNRHGFLAFSEIHPDYYQIPMADRQALLRAEAEAAEAEDEESDEAAEDRSERGGRNRRRRRGGRNRSRDEERVSAEAAEAAGEENADHADDQAEAEPSEDAAEAPQADEQHAEVQGSEDDDGDGKPAAQAARVEGDVISEPVESDAVEDAGARSAGHRNGNGNGDDSEVESVGAGDAFDEVQPRRRPVRRNYKIQEVIKRRQILLVQVVKEERGNKGAALTTYLSLAGRYSVLMPNTARGGGISRKITSAQDRKRLKEVVRELDVPQGMGVILRTAGESRTKAEIKRDYDYLLRLWENVRTLTLQSSAPALVYEEGSLIKRSVRDLYNKDIDEILVSGEDGYREAKDFMRMLMPSHAKVVQPYRDPVPIFARSGIEAQLDKMLQPQVTLKSGGYIIINQTEALVSIDVNSGRSTKEHSIEDTALQTNLEAAEEVARQLRLRDLAGLIVIDFIDMEENRNNRSVEKKLKDCLKNDRARIQVGRISHFGLLEMSRQRIRASVLESTMQSCPHCGGTGHVRSDSSVALHVIRAIEEFLLKDFRHNITVRTPVATALYVLNNKRRNLGDLEARFGLAITIEGDDTVGSQHYAIQRGSVVERPVAQPALAPTELPPVEDYEDAETEVEADDDEHVEAREGDSHRGDEEGEGHRDRKRRRRRRRRGRDRDREHVAASGEQAGHEHAEQDDAEDDDGNAIAHDAAADHGDADGDRKKRRRGKRGGRRNRRDEAVELEAAPAGNDNDEVDTGPTQDELQRQPVPATEPVTVAEDAPAAEQPAAEVQPEQPAKPKRAPRRRKAEAAPAEAEAVSVPAEEAPVANGSAEPAAESASEAAEEPAPTRRRAPRRKPAEKVEQQPEPVLSSTVADEVVQEEEEKPKRGGWWQRKSFF